MLSEGEGGEREIVHTFGRIAWRNFQNISMNIFKLIKTIYRVSNLIIIKKMKQNQKKKHKQREQPTRQAGSAANYEKLNETCELNEKLQFANSLVYVKLLMLYHYYSYIFWTTIDRNGNATKRRSRNNNATKRGKRKSLDFSFAISNLF